MCKSWFSKHLAELVNDDAPEKLRLRGSELSQCRQTVGVILVQYLARRDLMLFWDLLTSLSFRILQFFSPMCFRFHYRSTMKEANAQRTPSSSISEWALYASAFSMCSLDAFSGFFCLFKPSKSLLISQLQQHPFACGRTNFCFKKTTL